MSTVLFTHRYSMARVKELHASGHMPSQHLWGAPALEAAGYEVAYGPFGGERFKRLSGRLNNLLGDIDQEASLLRRDGLIYAAEASILRGIVRLPRATVGVVHQAGAWARHLDVAICLSTHTRQALLASGRDPRTTLVAPWGPDLDYPHYTPTGEDLIVSTGRTERDTRTLRSALDGLPARIHEGAPLLAFNDVLEDLRRASIVAIPLKRTDRVLALSEIADALALGKPIVMTRTPAIDFDPEAIGCGLTVAPYDEQGWREALHALVHDPYRRREMGRRGREYAQRGYNARAFGAAIVAGCGEISAPSAIA